MVACVFAWSIVCWYIIWLLPVCPPWCVLCGYVVWCMYACDDCVRACVCARVCDCVRLCVVCMCVFDWFYVCVLCCRCCCAGGCEFLSSESLCVSVVD